MPDPSPVEVLAAAIAHSRPIIAAVGEGQLALPTPCEGWDLHALLNHLAGRAVLSERAAAGMPVAEFPDATADLVGRNAAPTLQGLLDVSLTAWQSTDDLASPRSTPIGDVPGFALVVFQAQDIFVHGWDIARTIGTDHDFDPALTEMMIAMHHQSITSDIRAAFFGAEMAVPADAPAIDRLVGFLGRQP